MPYKIKKVNKGFKVCKRDEPSICFSKKPLSLSNAEKQMKAIGISEGMKGGCGCDIDCICGGSKPEPLNKKLYDEIKQDVYNKYPTHSIYRSMMIVKRYLDEGGRYKDEKPSKSSTKKWLDEQWLSANDYLRGKEIKCGNSDTEKKYNEYPLCYAKDRLKKFTKKELKSLINQKNKLKKSHLNTKEMTGKGQSEKYELHAVVIDKRIPLQEAKKISKHFIPKNKNFYRETTNSYRFRNYPKTIFKSFKSKKINDDITLIYGALKDHTKYIGAGWLGDLWKKAKTKYNEIKETIRLNPVLGVLGETYCGPNTQLEGQAPVSTTSKICRDHDYRYNTVEKAKKAGIDRDKRIEMTREADEIMLNELANTKESKLRDKIVHAISTAGIKAKVWAEDKGLIDPLKFSGGKRKLKY